MKYIFIILTFLTHCHAIHASTNQIFIFETTVVAPDSVSKTIKEKIRKRMKFEQDGVVSNGVPFVMMHDAADILLKYDIAPFPPTACFDTEYRVYFSGGHTEKPVSNFSCGFAVDKANGRAYKWNGLDMIEIEGSFTNRIFGARFPDGIFIAGSENFTVKTKENIIKNMEICREGMMTDRGPPKTLVEAENLLLKSMNVIKCLISCFEEEDMFYFSFGLSAEDAASFNFGFAVDKKNGCIYRWRL